MSRVFCVGHAVQDFVFYLSNMPHEAKKYRADALEFIGGGPAATAAVAISKLGGDAVLAARVGDDSVAEIIIRELQSYGVDCSLVKRMHNGQSSLSSVFVDENGERLIVNYLDPNQDPSTEWLPEILPDNIDVVLADTRWPEGSLHALNLARAANIPGLLDADSPVPADGDLIRAASHVAFSAEGLAEYSGNDNVSEALTDIDDQFDAWCCVTVGTKGTLLIKDGQPRFLGAYDVEVKDTLGAGDVWHGAFALALGEDLATDDAVQFAGAAAALKVAKGGGRSGAPTREEVDRLMEDQLEVPV